MNSSITLGHLDRNGRPVLPNRTVNRTSTDPDFSDFFELLDLISIGVAVYNTYKGNYKTAIAAITPMFTRVFEGKNVAASKTGRIIVPQDGLMGSAVPVAELRVVFRAWSGSDLTESDGQVFQDDDVPTKQVEHMGDQSFSQGDNNFWVSRWRFNVQDITPGEYGFTFAAGDDGWIFNVGVANILTVEVVPTRDGLQPGTHGDDLTKPTKQPQEPHLKPGQQRK
jgi:hypothetical protein